MDLIRIGPFEMCPSERRLSRDGVVLELGGRAFDLLRVLVDSPGRLVTKAALMERVWPRLVVDENNLSAQVAALRRVLGANAIKTVSGFGYRLELAVSTVEPAPPRPATTKQASAAPTAATAAACVRQRLPAPQRLAPLVGRAADIVALERVLQQSCLVTLVGGAGVGKTRLAQEVVARALAADHDALWVPLDGVRSASQVPSSIALALGLALADGSDAFTALSEALSEARILLVLDGVEHLAAELVNPLVTFLTVTAGVRVLLTSQAPLGAPGEAVFRLESLGLPRADAAPSEVAASAAVEVFVQRAAAADRSFVLGEQNVAAIAAICRQLDGNPLALELAAARLPALGASALLARLDDRFRLLRRGGHSPGSRHDALHSAFDWSYHLLAQAEQVVFNRLGAFAGSFTLDAAARAVEDVAIDRVDAADLIGRLVDRSLVGAMPGEPQRYSLSETARHYAIERLVATGERDAAAGRMAVTVLELLDHAYEAYWVLDETLWLRRFGAEIDNVRMALDWAIEHDRQLAVALYGSAWPLFVEADLFAEARVRFESTVRLIDAGVARPRLARFWEAVATYDSLRQCDRARYAAELAAAAYGDTGNDRARYYALMLLARNWRGDEMAAREVFGEARRLEDALWPTRLLLHGALTEGALLLSAGQLVDARLAYRHALRLALAVSERQALAATVHIVELDVACDDIAAALQLGRPMALSIRQPGQRAVRFELLAVVFKALLLGGERAQARAIGLEVQDLGQRQDKGRLYTVLDAMAFLACEEGRYAAAVRIVRAADVVYQSDAKSGRGPIDERLRVKVAAILEREIGSGWSATCQGRPADEFEACALALAIEA